MNANQRRRLLRLTSVALLLLILLTGLPPSRAQEHAVRGGDPQGDLAPAQPRAYRVRITWLIDIGPLADKVNDAAKRALPNELKPVGDELEKLGMRNLYVAARTMVRCTDDDEFAMFGRAKLIEPADLAIEGQFLSDRDPARPRLRIRLSGQQVKLVGSESTRSGPKQATYAPREIVNIQTTVITAPGKPIVLGVSPMEDVTSAFVVTVEEE